MNVFVTGGTGAIGRHAVPALVAAGHDVSALARSPEKARQLADQGATPVEVSLFDQEALVDAFAGHDAVANLATAIPPNNKFMSKQAWAANTRIRTEGSANVVDAAIQVGVDRVVQESVVMLYADGGDEWLDEKAPTDRFPVAVANHAAEASANRFTSAGGIGIVLRFGWFYGPGATHSEEFFDLAKKHLAVQMGAPQTFLSSIHMADAGTAVAAALDAPAGTYNVVDDEPLTKRAYADALASAADTKPWLRPPGRAAKLLGNQTTGLTRSVRASNAKFKNATGWAPQYPSAREGWLATARVLESTQPT